MSKSSEVINPTCYDELIKTLQSAGEIFEAGKFSRWTSLMGTDPLDAPEEDRRMESRMGVLLTYCHHVLEDVKGIVSCLPSPESLEDINLKRLDSFMGELYSWTDADIFWFFENSFEDQDSADALLYKLRGYLAVAYSICTRLLSASQEIVTVTTFSECLGKVFSCQIVGASKHNGSLGYRIPDWRANKKGQTLIANLGVFASKQVVPEGLFKVACRKLYAKYFFKFLSDASLSITGDIINQILQYLIFCPSEQYVEKYFPSVLDIGKYSASKQNVEKYSLLAAKVFSYAAKQPVGSGALWPIPKAVCDAQAESFQAEKEASASLASSAHTSGVRKI